MKRILTTMMCCLSMIATLAQGPMVLLSNGIEMPQFGIGTFNVPSNDECKQAVLTALRAGYRHIDTAHAYIDERGVGEAVNEFVAEGGCQRSDIWVTSKIWPSEYSDPTAIDRMLRRLNLDYIDLVYPHQPVGDIKTAWRNLERAVKQRKVRALGLSNFEVPGAEEWFQWCVDSTEIKPVIMQMECHPYAQRIEKRALALKYGMKVECWFPLGGAMSQGALLKDPVIMKIAEAHKVSPAQVILRWEIQEGLLSIPGATNPDYIKENIAAAQGLVNGKPFALTAKEMKQMRKLNKEQRFFNASYEQAKGYVNFPIMDEQERAEAELTMLSAKKWQWMAEKNVNELANLFHRDAMFVHMGGAWGRSAELQTIEKGFIWYKHADVHSVESRISGNTAVVYSDIQLTSEVGGREVSFPFFVSEVYTKEGDGWKLVTLAFTKKM
ncbi:MAG: aldo/keto reductase [Muribaculaceae bacterium]